ncbi:MAG: hypothetical protein ACI379_13135 [Nocardioides sp.]|uniref:hypothetical protein n=1 Tax=Nocardioides sp. TaxID=35761 RepID=UPI003F0A3F5E
MRIRLTAATVLALGLITQGCSSGVAEGDGQPRANSTVLSIVVVDGPQYSTVEELTAVSTHVLEGTVTGISFSERDDGGVVARAALRSFSWGSKSPRH